MPYNYKFINILHQYDTVKYTLIITDSDEIMPTNHIPILLNSCENTEENLLSIANSCINSCISDYNLTKIQKVDQIEVLNEVIPSDTISTPDITTDVPVDINTNNN
jgi:hypothetical protein